MKKVNNAQQFNNTLTTNYVKKSNALIDGFFSASLLENIILTLGITKAEYKENRMIGVITASELISILSIMNECDVSSPKNIYIRMKKVVDNIRMSHQDIIIDIPSLNKYGYTPICGPVLYDNGKIIIKFEPDVTEYIKDIKSNYTLLYLPVLFSLSTTYSFRLYEILKSKAYSFDENNNQFTFMINLSKLRLLLGLVDVSSSEVKKAFNQPSPNLDKIVETYGKYSRWDTFKYKVLDPSIKEINEKTDLCVSIDPDLHGHGGKTCGVFFTVCKKNQNNAASDTLNDELLDKIDELSNYFDVPIKAKDIKTLLAAANNDVDVVKKAYDLSRKRDDIENIVGWLLTAIKKSFI